MRAALASLLLAMVGCFPGDAGGLRYGDPLPSFTATALAGGEPVSLDRYEGRVLLLNLWATWCIPCRTETPYLQSLFTEYASRGFHVVGVSVDPSPDRPAVEAFVDEMGVEYDILLDPEGTSEKVFRARGLPNSILVDATGTVLFSWLGPIEEGDPTFLAGLEEALAGR